MIAVPIGPPLRMAVVASPGYFAVNPVPKTPHDLMMHRCINQRMPTSGGLYVWDFAKKGKQVNVRVDGPLIFNTAPPQVDAALAGAGVALLPEDELGSQIDEGRLVRVSRIGALRSPATTSTTRAGANHRRRFSWC
ncbi:LysR substrate-binding domain-containing protein [Roseateles sp.]|uniref:LysR substrate-binding domain-containing protein n=1 Tax=Roseateles sp. TaxID=1971397 RepID=UPI003BAC5F33